MSSTPATEPTPTARSMVDLPDPRAILFDLDGTLVETVHLRIAGWERALQQSGIEVRSEEIAAYIGADGRWLAREMGKRVGRRLDWAESDALDRLSGSIFDELNTAPQLLPGAQELLAALEKSRFTFAIATASQPGQVAVSVAALRLPSPPPITDAGHVEHAKPAPDLLLAAAAQLGIAPERCWYVGDSTWDMMAAVGAGMTGIGLVGGLADARALLVAGAAVAIEGLGDLLAALRGRGLVR